MRILGQSFDELRATRTSVKWRFHEPDVLPVWVAEMDARPCDPVVEAVTAAIARGDTGYSWAPPYARAFAAFAERRWGWSVDPEAAMVVPDMMIGIEELIHALVPPDGAVVISPPVYDSFFGFVHATRRRLVVAPLGGDGRLDADALERAFADAGAGAAYLLCNPQNPTGTVHAAGELTMLARLADAHGVQVISDEIHAPLVMPGTPFVPYLAAAGSERGVALASASKAWNLAGLKVALVLPGEGARAVLARLPEVVRHGANHLAVIAQTAAYEAGEPWLDQLLGELVENRALLERLLADALPEIVIHPSAATYLAWLDCRALDLGDDPALVFRTRGRVALSSGPTYGAPGAGFARFNYGTSPEMIAEAVRRMTVAVG